MTVTSRSERGFDDADEPLGVWLGADEAKGRVEGDG